MNLCGVTGSGIDWPAEKHRDIERVCAGQSVVLT